MLCCVVGYGFSLMLAVAQLLILGLKATTDTLIQGSTADRVGALSTTCYTYTESDRTLNPKQRSLVPSLPICPWARRALTA